MARKKAKYCKACEMKFMGNHVCTGLNKMVLYDDPIMVDIVKGVAKGPDVSKPFDVTKALHEQYGSELAPPDKDNDSNSGGV